MAEPAFGVRTAPDWVGVHAYHHADLDGVLTTAVGPLVAQLRRDGSARSWFYLRYWEGGNHLRLRVRPAPGAATAVRVRVATALRAHLRAHPSPDLLDEAAYRRLATVFAAGEQRGRFETALRPNNSVAFVPYRPEHERFGRGPSLAAVERHFAESSALALDLVEAVPDPRRRAATCFGLVLLAWLTALPDPAALARWTTGLYDAWAGRFGESRSAPGTPSDLDERYLSQRDALVASLEAIEELSTARVDRDGPASQRWLASVRALRDALVELVASGRFRPAVRPGWEGVAGSGDPRSQLLAVVDVCAHLLCNRLGLTSAQECYVRFLAARALADRAGVGS